MKTKNKVSGYLNNQDGAYTVWLFMGLVTLLVVILSIFDVGQFTQGKMDFQTAADMTAYSGAIWQARFLNLVSLSNLAIVACYAIIVFIILVTLTICVLSIIPIPGLQVLIGFCHMLTTNSPTWIDNTYKVALHIDKYQNMILKPDLLGFWAQAECMKIAALNVTGSKLNLPDFEAGKSAEDYLSEALTDNTFGGGLALGSGSNFKDIVGLSLHVKEDAGFDDFANNILGNFSELISIDGNDPPGMKQKTIERKEQQIGRWSEFEHPEKKLRKVRVRPRRDSEGNPVYNYEWKCLTTGRKIYARINDKNYYRRIYGVELNSQGNYTVWTTKPRHWEDISFTNISCGYSDCETSTCTIRHKYRVFINPTNDKLEGSVDGGYVYEDAEGVERQFSGFNIPVNLGIPSPACLESDWMDHNKLLSIVVGHQPATNYTNSDEDYMTLCFSEAHPYSSTHTQNYDVMLLLPNWEAKLKKVSAVGDIISFLPENIRNIIVGISDEVILH